MYVLTHWHAKKIFFVYIDDLLSIFWAQFERNFNFSKTAHHDNEINQSQHWAKKKKEPIWTQRKMHATHV